VFVALIFHHAMRIQLYNIVICLLFGLLNT